MNTENQKNHIPDRITPKLPEDAYPRMTPDQKSKLIVAAATNAKKRDLMLDKGYYTVIVFQCKEQVKAFMDALEYPKQPGDEYWVDGMKLASHLGIPLPEVDAAMLHKVYGIRVADRQIKEAEANGLKFLKPKKRAKKGPA